MSNLSNDDMSLILEKMKEILSGISESCDSELNYAIVLECGCNCMASSSLDPGEAQKLLGRASEGLEIVREQHKRRN